jgi:hypothetical protein
MYAIQIPENVAKVTVSRCWNLGTILITQGASDMLDHENIEVGWLLMRHWAEDYGLVSADEKEHIRTTVNRGEGRPFTSLFDAGEDCLKVVTLPTQTRTVVCLTRED